MPHGSVITILVVYGGVLRITLVLNQLDYVCATEASRIYMLRWNDNFGHPMYERHEDSTIRFETNCYLVDMATSLMDWP